MTSDLFARLGGLLEEHFRTYAEIAVYAVEQDDYQTADYAMKVLSVLETFVSASLVDECSQQVTARMADVKKPH